MGKHENVTWKIVLLSDFFSEEEKMKTIPETEAIDGKRFDTNVFYACLVFSSISLAQVGC